MKNHISNSSDQNALISIPLSRYRELRKAEIRCEKIKFRYRIPFPATASIHFIRFPRDNFYIKFNKNTKILELIESYQKTAADANKEIDLVLQTINDFYDELIKLKSFSPRQFRKWKKDVSIEKMEFLHIYKYKFPIIDISK